MSNSKSWQLKLYLPSLSAKLPVIMRWITMAEDRFCRSPLPFSCLIDNIERRDLLRPLSGDGEGVLRARLIPNASPATSFRMHTLRSDPGSGRSFRVFDKETRESRRFNLDRLRLWQSGFVNESLSLPKESLWPLDRFSEENFLTALWGDVRSLRSKGVSTDGDWRYERAFFVSIELVRGMSTLNSRRFPDCTD